MNENELKEILSSNIRTFRLNKGLNQQELSEKAGITDKFISIIETGRGLCSLEKLSSIANALDVEPYELLLPSNKTISYDSRKTKELMRQLHKNLDDAVSTLERFLTAEK